MENTSKTLIVQLADIGDLVLAAPAIQGYRHRNPETRVSILTKPGNRELAQHLADSIIVVDKHLFDSTAALVNPVALVAVARLVARLRRDRFDEVILLHHLVTRWGAVKFAALSFAARAPVRRGLDNGRGKFLTDPIPDHGFNAQSEADYWTELLGTTVSSESLSMGTSGDASEILKDVPPAYAVIHPGSGTFSTARRWPLEYFAELIDALHEMDMQVVVVGGAEEIELGQTLVEGRGGYVRNLVGKTDLPQLAEVLRKASLFVGNDGGVAQLSGMLEIPRVVIFGPTSPSTWLKANPRTRVARIDVACSPCLYRYDGLGSRAGCATRECLVNLHPDRVMLQVKDLLAETVIA